MPRVRKPTVVLEMSGAFRKDPQRRAARANEPQLAKGIGEPPEWLDAGARAEWWRVVPDLEAAGVTTRVESSMLAAYCQAVSRMIAAETIIAADGIVAFGQRGPMKHPAVAIARECALIIAKIGSEFGLTPASRSKIKATPKQEPNAFADV